jgi:hypothetical protein
VKKTFVVVKPAPLQFNVKIAAFVSSALLKHFSFVYSTFISSLCHITVLLFAVFGLKNTLKRRSKHRKLTSGCMWIIGLDTSRSALCTVRALSVVSHCTAQGRIPSNFVLRGLHVAKLILGYSGTLI